VVSIMWRSTRPHLSLANSTH